ncbi:S41 family peptidase [Hymenobacter ruricola]|uniref:Tail specific protease domain-containing protein n=1 Tax=Hymenobacter ruricola TaxID=2791023 RepID=A0ABS0IAS0_9BACT|nr:hypothetical protein [Hymenobacter ruricola]MBF9224071.1 hypothetical protein [Hymenobacter ruricola]
MNRFLLPRLLLLAVALGAAPPGHAQVSLTPAQWRQDLQVVLDSFLLRDKTFSPAAAARFRTRVTNLRDSAALKTSPQLLVGLAAAVASSGNAHTRLYLLRNRSVLRRYPVRLWWFADGLYVVKTTPEHAALLGAKVGRLAGQPPDALRRRVAPLYAGSAGWKDYMSTYTLTSPEILQGLGLAGADGNTPLEVRTRAGKRLTTQLLPLPLTPSRQPLEAWWDLMPGHPGRGATWQSALPNDSTQLPLYLCRPQRYYWQHYLPAEKLLYVQYNRAGNQPGTETFEAFGAQVLAELRARPVAKAVVDLRLNTGGNLQVAQAFFGQLAAVAKERGAGLYVVTGPATFSAGLFHAAQLRQAGAVVVGAPVGDSLDFWAEGGNLTLPNSGLDLHYADRFHGYSPAPHPELAPYLYLDLAVPDLTPRLRAELTGREYFAGRDPALVAIIRQK